VARIEPKINYAMAREIAVMILDDIMSLIRLIPEDLRFIEIRGVKKMNKIYTTVSGEDRVYTYRYRVIDVNGDSVIVREDSLSRDLLRNLKAESLLRTIRGQLESIITIAKTIIEDPEELEKVDDNGDNEY
jgi:hypothetical protein